MPLHTSVVRCFSTATEFERGAQIPIAERTPARKISPARLAKEWGVCPRKIVEWIKAGELRAIDAATKADGKRPRYLIDRDAVADFEEKRAVLPAETPAPRRRRKALRLVKSYV